MNLSLGSQGGDGTISWLIHHQKKNPTTNKQIDLWSWPLSNGRKRKNWEEEELHVLFWLWVANGTSHRIQLISPLTLCQGSYISWRDSSETEFQSSCQLHLLSFGANSYSPFSFFLPVIINFPGHLYAQGSGLAQAVLFACRLNICCGSSCSLLVPNGSCNSQNSEKCI